MSGTAASKVKGLRASSPERAFMIRASAVLVLLVRWTCKAGAREAVHHEVDETRQKKMLWRDIHPESKRTVLR